MKSPNLGLMQTRTMEIDTLVDQLLLLMFDYKHLAIGADGSVSPVCIQRVKRVRDALALPSSLSESDALKERMSHRIMEMSQRWGKTLEKIQHNTDECRREYEEAIEFDSQEREQLLSKFKEFKEQVLELVSDYERVATDGNGNIRPFRTELIQSIRMLLHNLRERKHYRRHTGPPEKS